jgi:hypothetical protein
VLRLVEDVGHLLRDWEVVMVGVDTWLESTSRRRACERTFARLVRFAVCVNLEIFVRITFKLTVVGALI